jgi:7,8-dihydroneopterin aldolase/epimerase/oxygenase
MRFFRVGPVTLMDLVFVRDLRIDAVIGVYEWERNIRQTLIFDIEMAVDLDRAAASDDIADAVDYKAVSDRLRAFVDASRFQLVETLAVRCAALVRDEFGVAWLRLTVNKRGAVGAGTDVGIVIERGVRP